MSTSVVVAIGGNALSPSGEAGTIANQFRHTRRSLSPIVEYVCRGHDVVVVHGNGPQVGDELRRGEVAREEVEPLPLGVLVASTAGWIGYMIQQSLQNALEAAGSDRGVVTLLTQLLVDPDDPAVSEPRKFVGREVDPAARADLEAQGWTIEEDARGRLRRRVPSPDPVGIVEADLLRDTLASGRVVIAAGGGGIPVYRDPELGLEGLDVVLDKDRSAALVAREVEASQLLVLTDVDAVYRDFGTADARPVGRISASEARELLGSGELGVGSMRPKVEAAVEFVEAGGERAVIAHLEEAATALDGGTGTSIHPD